MSYIREFNRRSYACQRSRVNGLFRPAFQLRFWSYRAKTWRERFGYRPYRWGRA